MGLALRTHAAPPPRRAVIITGDDFGLSAAINRALVMAHREGILTCASLMVSGPAGAEAISLARELPRLCLGLHLTLLQGRAVLPRWAIPHLVDQHGNFCNQPIWTGLRYFFAPRLREEIRRELAAQIEAALRTGLTFWFLNSHLNMHLHPSVWPMVRQLALEYKIPAVRLAQEKLTTTLALNRSRLVYKIVHALIFSWLSGRARRDVARSGLKTNDHVFGLLNDGQMDESYLLGLLPRLAPGVTEIYFHPAPFVDAELRRWMPHYRHQAELAALLSPRVRTALDSSGVEITDYQHL